MKIIFFDGYCSLCDGFVDWGLRHDKAEHIQFASLQGLTAQKIILDPSLLINPETVLYWRDTKIYFESDAILYYLKDLKNAWSLFFVFILIPKLIRNFVYRLIAKNRYKLFKKKLTCRIPTAQERERLLN